jgi:hypothetical protein
MKGWIDRNHQFLGLAVPFIWGALNFLAKVFEWKLPWDFRAFAMLLALTYVPAFLWLLRTKPDLRKALKAVAKSPTTWLSFSVLTIVVWLGALTSLTFRHLESTSTSQLPAEPAPPTQLSVSTRTPAPTPTYAAGADIADSCIYAAIWAPSEHALFSTDPRGCYQMAAWGISARQFGSGVPGATPGSQQLGLSVELVNDTSAEVLRGMYFRLPSIDRASFVISLDIALQGLQGEAARANPNLVLGIGMPDNTLTSGSYLFYRVLSGSQHVYVFTGDSVFNKGSCKYEQDRDCYYLKPQHVAFAVSGNSVTIQTDQVTLRELPISRRDSAVFWVGYRLPPGGSVQAFLWNIAIK